MPRDEIRLEVQYGDRPSDVIDLEPLQFPSSLEMEVEQKRDSIQIPFKDGQLSGDARLSRRRITVEGRILTDFSSGDGESVSQKVERIKSRLMFPIQRFKRGATSFRRFPRVNLFHSPDGFHFKRLVADAFLESFSERVLNSYGASEVRMSIISDDPFLYSGKESAHVLTPIASGDRVAAGVGTDNKDYIEMGQGSSAKIDANAGIVQPFDLPFPSVREIVFYPLSNTNSPTWSAHVSLVKYPEMAVVGSTVVTAADWDASVGSAMVIPLVATGLSPGKYAVMMMAEASAGSGERHVATVVRDATFAEHPSEDLLQTTDGSTTTVLSTEQMLRFDIMLTGRQYEVTNVGSAPVPIEVEGDVSGLKAEYLWIHNLDDYLRSADFMGRRFLVLDEIEANAAANRKSFVVDSSRPAVKVLQSGIMTDVLPEGYFMPRLVPGVNRLVVGFGGDDVTGVSMTLRYRPRFV